jgi:hypothetical protein
VGDGREDCGCPRCGQKGRLATWTDSRPEDVTPVAVLAACFACGAEARISTDRFALHQALVELHRELQRDCEAKNARLKGHQRRQRLSGLAEPKTRREAERLAGGE